jgi:glycosyltransferase involved in cell wall biosynthesis
MSFRKGIKIIFLVPYPFNSAPGQRFRYEQYISQLKEVGAIVRIFPFLSNKANGLLYKSGHVIKKFLYVSLGFVKRVLTLYASSGADFIFIFREATPIGPPFIEWIIARIFRKKIIYDFDDAIWLTDRKKESVLLRTIKWRSKVATICRWSHKVSCGNEYLCAFAKQFNDNVVYNPTTIDTELLHDPKLYSKRGDDRIIIGWSGSHSTLKYLNDLESLLQRLEQKYDRVDFWIIADKPPELKLTRLIFKPWSLESEIVDLAQIDVGIMPLPNDEWTKGKCGFKALQYMALEIPAVVSAVGANKKIIDHCVDGFLCGDDSDWLAYLTELIINADLRKRIGKQARKKIINNYSVASNSETFLSLFN